MMRGNSLAHFSVLLFVAARILSGADVVIAQASKTDPEPHIVEPIITEETMPNEPGDWDLRFSGSYRCRGTEGSGFLPRTQLFFGIANRWGGEIEVPLAFAKAGTNRYGVGDISASVKYLVRKPSARMPGFVLGLETTFPTGNANSGLGEGVFEAAPFVATVYAFRRAVLQGNVGYSIFTGSAEPKQATNSSITSPRHSQLCDSTHLYCGRSTAPTLPAGIASLFLPV